MSMDFLANALMITGCLAVCWGICLFCYSFISNLYVSDGVKNMCNNMFFLKKRGPWNSPEYHFFVKGENTKIKIIRGCLETTLYIYKNDKLFFSENMWDKDFQASLNRAEIIFMKEQIWEILVSEDIAWSSDSVRKYFCKPRLDF